MSFGIILECIEGQISNIEDILIRGKTQAKHQEVLKKLEGAGATLNAEKCEFSKREVKFEWYVLNQDGIMSDPEKTNSIRNMDPP